MCAHSITEFPGRDPVASSMTGRSCRKLGCQVAKSEAVPALYSSAAMAPVAPGDQFWLFWKAGGGSLGNWPQAAKITEPSIKATAG